ncbi:hypothetical protein [Microbacterium marinilacus]|uniref:Uncharacterized protein n=1 Tax=Microbacterium marinilacus TaxID=415209 RepID=A0ABP7BA90_9MICO|nr:hypothetical protein [Microbacterium marinilacus]MBY0687010.1 hypothetical protein [Microbacterium marinilacus]
MIASVLPRRSLEPVVVDTDRDVVILSHPIRDARLDPDQARALAAALVTAANRIDDVRPLRRRTDVDDELRERDG